MATDNGSKTLLNENALSRRTAVASLGSLIVPRHVLGGPGYQAPSDTLTIVGVGVGGMGRGYLGNFRNERIAAMCDLDPEGYAARAFHAFPQARMYRDYREMFDKENFDAVVIAVPDHWHAMILMESLRRRKHVYCAKPLTHTLHELRTVMEAAREAKVATQTSIQTCASDNSCTTAEILMSGAIGCSARGSPLDGSSLGAGGNAASRRKSIGAERTGLGSMDRSCALPAVSSDLPPVELARLVGLWRGYRRRHGVSFDQCVL